MIDVGQITIIGTGLLGGSVGLGLRAAGFAGRIVGVGRRAQTLDTAQRLGCIDEGTTEWGPAVAGSGLVVLATPLGAFAAALERIAGHDHPGLIITDVGSTKQQVCADAKRLLPDPSRFVPAHPMAGSEHAGPEHATADLLTGRLCILTPEGVDSNDDALTHVKALWQSLGMRLIEMTPRQHDEQVAVVSHLPHAVAALLVELGRERDALGVASTGLRDTTRIASGDPAIWRDIFATNRPAVADALDGLIDQLQAFKHALNDGHDEKLVDLLTRAKRARDQWVRDSGV